MILMGSRQRGNTFYYFFVFCWIKILSKRYRFNKDSLKIMFLRYFHFFWQVTTIFQFFWQGTTFFQLFPNFLLWHCKGVFGSKHRKNKNSRNCFQRVFVLQDFFIFRKIVIFMMNCTRWFKIFCIFVFEKTHLGIRIDAKTVFTFLFFLWMPLKNQRSMMKKTVKIRVFTFLINFPSLKNRFPEISF